MNPIGSARSMGFGLLDSIDDNRESVSHDSSSLPDSEYEGSQEDEMKIAKEEDMIVNLNISASSDLNLIKDTQTHDKMPHISAVLLDYD